MVECGCGHKLEWANRDQVGQLQWHMFACTLPEETNVHRRWLQAVRRDIASHVKDAAIARIIVRYWTHTNDGHIAHRCCPAGPTVTLARSLNAVEKRSLAIRRRGATYA